MTLCWIVSVTDKWQSSHFIFFLMCVLSHDRYPFLPTSSSMKIRRPGRLTLFQVANNFNGIWKKKMSLYFLLKNTQIEESILSDTTDWTKDCLIVRASQLLLNNHEQKKKKRYLGWNLWTWYYLYIGFQKLTLPTSTNHQVWEDPAQNYHIAPRHSALLFPAHLPSPTEFTWRR